ncbi:hypothetical protein EYF80_047504 [Liparis tanakae]|uniref:Uncharacterized protein n=1 Tax=Liparis tanakae TaxID=230148 RepID=A0A4Z2FNJ2_9TELE|nr:hypothetical protein EYF80_047504 [Liparis tanakae]
MDASRPVTRGRLQTAVPERRAADSGRQEERNKPLAQGNKSDTRTAFGQSQTHQISLYLLVQVPGRRSISASGIV